MNLVKRKKILDLLLLLLFFILEAGMFFPPKLHAALGILFLAGILAHCKANAGFFAALSKGTWPVKRKANAAVIFLFALTLLMAAVSGLALSFQMSGPNWRSLHLIAAMAGLVLLLCHLFFHMKQYLHGPKALLAGIFTVLLMMGGLVGLPYLDRWYKPVTIDRNAAIAGEKVNLPGKTLIVYFSWAENAVYPEKVDAVSGASLLKDGNILLGNAQVLAEMAQNATNGDLLSLKVKAPYPAAYLPTTKRAGEELHGNILPPLKNTLPDVAAYRTIILVYPLWYGTLPMPVETFLHETDLTGKTLLPIITHGGSGAGRSVEDLKKLTAAKVEDPLTVYSSNAGKSRKEVGEYLKKFGKE